MDLSIVIVSYNTKELLLDCLLSINVPAKLKVEVFVVDNHSKDSTPSMVRKKFPDFQLITNSQNLGFSKANNQALVKARGKYILILNPDTKVMLDTLGKMIDFMDQNEKVAIATCRVELANGRLDPDCHRLFPTPWRAFCHFLGLSRIFKGSKLFDQYRMGFLDPDQQSQIDACMGAFMMIRPKVLKDIGLFDEDFFFYGEDLDFCYRAKEKGYQIVYTPITRIIHLRGAASGIKKSTAHLTKATDESKRLALLESARAMRLFYKKHLAKNYPLFINWFIYFAISVIERLRLLKIT